MLRWRDERGAGSGGVEGRRGGGVRRGVDVCSDGVGRHFEGGGLGWTLLVESCCRNISMAKKRSCE